MKSKRYVIALRNFSLAMVVLGMASATIAVDLPVPPATVEGRHHWQQVERVLTHPRCLNCHVAGSQPRQGDDRHPHLFHVLRGAGDRGATGLLCATCHQSVNQSASGVPGAPDWRLPVHAMAWESVPGKPMSSAQLCETLGDHKKNGGRDGVALLQHITTEPLVLWAWSPGLNSTGQSRTVPPLPHDEFVEAFKNWIRAGAPCPISKVK